MYLQLSLRTSHETLKHDRVVLDIPRIQGKGPLTRPMAGLYGTDIARTVDGTLWNDLPFLVGNMAELWIDNALPMAGTQPLVLFRCLFEERQELRTDDDPDDKNPRRTMSSLEIMHLLLAAFAWFDEAA
ncbi:uncharacterized protein N7479_001193 [Penicillium vulpinum]|uniref:uncharacterized protein n=1 Tax=Penicillium vulpinum TaxID=29845 RepID=UPI0025487E7A|nr:uncharacterized protein N7479_001193 [Penicillium vulpinum]KAJ5971275.1 hypothetical protein N7479_001193 [Penicillium vulpinum]